jgi:ethanolamine kinase
MEQELVVELSDHGFGPEIYCTFSGGRCEEFFHSRRPLEPLESLEMTPVDLVGLTAAQLAKFHELKLHSLSARNAHYEETMINWNKLAENVRFADEAKQAALEALNLREVLDEFAACKGGQMAPEPQVESEFTIAGVLLDIVPIHTDLLSANIMYDEKEKDVKFIDYEYAQLGPAGLDLANHFNAVPEGMLIQDGCLDVKRYPSKEIRLHFLKTYLKGRETVAEDAEILTDEGLDFGLRVLLAMSCEAEIRWVIWAVVQAQYSPVDFDYLNYAQMRKDAYFKYKQVAQEAMATQ